MGKAGSQMPYVFISYSHKDKEYAHRLERALKRRGFEVWLDDRIDYGSEWPHEIERRLDGCKAMILIMTAHSRGSEWVQNELARAKQRRKSVFPLLLDGNEPWLAVAATQCVDVRDGELPKKAFYDTLGGVVPRKYEAGRVVVNSIGMKLVYIPARSFMMGSPSSEEGHCSDEGPQHLVHISKGFWMGQTVVTQGQYKSIMNAQPWSGRKYVQEDANNPAVCVRWDDVVEFCRKLSHQEGKVYRLPTEAEWEYACRAGTTTRFSFRDSASSLGDYAWFDDNTCEVDEEYAHSVGQKKPNPWGLYDMHGNVFEWCLDWFSEDHYGKNPGGPDTGSDRVLRGGSWLNPPQYCRSADRNWDPPSGRGSNLGFRVARSFVSK